MPVRVGLREAMNVNGTMQNVAETPSGIGVPTGRIGEGRVRARVARSLKTFVPRYSGVSADRLFHEAGIDAALLDRPDATVSLPRIVELLRLSAEQTGDPCFGLELGAHMPWSDLDVLGYLMVNSPTLAEGLANASRYYRVQQSSGGLTLRTERKVTRVSFALRGGVGSDVQHAQIVLGLLLRFCRERGGHADLAPFEVRFTHGARGESARYNRYFGERVRFDQPENLLVFDQDELERPLEAADPHLFPILQRHADDLLARLPLHDDLVGQVRQLVTASLESGDIGLKEVAERLKIGARTLQRRLEGEGRPFYELVTETRATMARKYLRDPSLSLTEIAFRLGYSDLSAFSRAFRRWTRQTPLEFRRSASA